MRAKATASKAWEYVKKDIEASDPKVAKKRAPFLSRLYHAINRTFPTIIDQIEKSQIDPLAEFKSTQYGPEIKKVKFHRLDRPVRVGFFPVAGNPLWWGHLLAALMSQTALKLDAVVFRVQGEIRYKDMPETDRVPVKDRHEIVKKTLTNFYPLFRYTDLGAEPDNEEEGSSEMHRFFKLNKKTKIHVFYLLGVESQERVIKYFNQQYTAAKKNHFAPQPNYKFTIGWIQRGEYGAKITLQELDKFSEKIRQKYHCPHKIESTLIKDPRIDLQVSSTYYRNTHDSAIVPSVIHQHAKAHGFYGHPAIDPRTGQPYDYSEEEQFKIKLRPISEGIANQIVRTIERNGQNPTLVISIDGPSGSGKTTLAQEVIQFLKLRHYQGLHIPFDIFLKEKNWRAEMEKKILAKSKKYYQEEIFWNIKAREKLVKQINRFKKTKQKQAILLVKDGYNRLNKKRQNYRFKLKKGMVIIVEGKYANREELSPFFDLHYRLDDNLDRTKAKFEIRTRSLSPNTADNQMRFYDVGLIPSFQKYARRTKKVIDCIINLRNEEWRLDLTKEL